MVAWCLAAQSDLGAGLVRLADDVLDHPFHGIVLFVEKFGKILRVAIDAKCELGKIVAADREAVEAFGKSLCQNDIRGNFAHDIDLESVFAAAQAVLGHDRQYAVGFRDRAAERDHDDHIGKAHFFTHASDGLAFQGKSLAIAR